MLDHVPKSKLMQIVGDRLFTDQMSFMSPTQPIKPLFHCLIAYVAIFG